MTAAKKLKLKKCKAVGCDVEFIQYSSLNPYCSGSCQREDKPSVLRVKIQAKGKRQAIKVKSRKQLTDIQKDVHLRLRAMGCCVGRFVYGKGGTPPDIHHITVGSRRLGESFVIPLSPIVHRQGTAQFPSIHSVNGKWGGKKQFKAAYGYDEFELLALCEQELGFKYSEVAA